VPTWTTWRPGRGDLVSISAAASDGAGPQDDPPRRQALVVSPAAYSAAVGLALVCPVVAEVKGYPFEVRLYDEVDPHGVILADRVGVVDVRARGVRLVRRVPDEVTRKVLERLQALWG
jgi:mRNA interferase MazF